MNLLAVPLLALAGIGKLLPFSCCGKNGQSYQTPARDVMLSCASDQIGRGWGFGLHQALDQTGAVLGPLVVATVLHFKGGYREGFGLLLIPALIALSLLFLASRLYPNPHDLGGVNAPKSESKTLPRTFWLYVLAVG